MFSRFLYSSYILVARAARYFYAKFLEPRSGNEDNRRREFILNIILLGSIVLIFILDLKVLSNELTLGAAYKGVSFAAFSAILGIFLILYILSRRGWYIISAYLVTALYFASVLYASYHWGVDLASAALGYALLIVIASILIGTRFSFVVTAITSAVITYIWKLQLNGTIKPLWYWKYQPRLDDVYGVITVYLLIMIVSWLSNREIERSLARARKSEAELMQERDLLEIKVEERTEELRQAQIEKMTQFYRFADLGRLASGLFHDLVNPLNALSLQVEHLRAESAKESAADARAYLDRASTATKRIEKFVESVRKQIQNREIEAVFSLNKEVEEVLEVLSYKARKANVDIMFAAESEISTIGNPLRFHQLVSNLVANAIDSYDDIARPNDRKVIIALGKSNGTVELIVQDYGSGISVENIENIFAPFFTTKEIDKGTGIGLSTAKDIVEKNFYGSISVKSVVGEGSKFTIYFPQKT
jgi:signal transduction histidine kinase